MNASALYGDRMNSQVAAAFDALWLGFSSVEVGKLRRGLRGLLGHHVPPAPQLDADLWEWRGRLVQFCDALLLNAASSAPAPLSLTADTAVAL